MKIDLSIIGRDRNEPLHKQLASVLRAAIKDGHYRPGERIEPGREFARRAALSHPTVTRAFQDLAAEGLIVRKVGAGTFVADHIGDHIADEDTKRATIGVFQYHCWNEFFERILRGIRQVCRRPEFVHVPLLPEDYANGNEDRLLAELSDRNIDAVLACPSLTIDCPGLTKDNLGLTIDESHRFLLRQLIPRIPVVLMDVYLPGIACDTVMTNNEEAAYQIARHLLDLGHTKIAFVSHSVKYPYTTSIRDRIAGMKRALREACIEHEPDWVVGFRRTGGPLVQEEDHVRQAVFDLLDRPRSRRPTAIMCVNDTFAPLVVQCLRERDVAIPDEMSVTGFDDLAHAADMNPPLTTVAQQLEQIGRQAARRAFRRVRDPDRPATHLVLEGTLVVRASTAAPPDGMGWPSADRTLSRATRTASRVG